MIAEKKRANMRIYFRLVDALRRLLGDDEAASQPFGIQVAALKAGIRMCKADALAFPYSPPKTPARVRA